MSPWLLVAIGGYLVCLIAAWILVWKFRASTQQWRDLAEAWEAIADARERIILRQQTVIAALQMICRTAGVAVTVTDQADGVDIVVLPTDPRPEIRH